MKLKFYHITGFCAVLLGGCAAYFSVFGISKMLAGATNAAIIMASSLEFSKIIITSYLYQYRKKVNKFLGTYVTLAIIVLMIATSWGVYGFLSNAYQTRAGEVEKLETDSSTLDDQQGLLFQQIRIKEQQMIDLQSRIRMLNNTRTSQEQRLSSVTERSDRRMINNIRRDISEADNEIKSLNQQISSIITEINGFNNSIRDLKLSKNQLSKKINEADIGPLRYIAKLFKIKANQVVNIFIIFIVLVLDPLAIAFVIITTSLIQEKAKPQSIDSPKPTRKYTKHTLQKHNPTEEFFKK